PAPFGYRWDTAWHRCESRRIAWPTYSWLCRRCTNHSVARITRFAGAPSLFWNQRSHCHRRAFSVRSAADRSQHRDRSAGHPASIARVGSCVGTQSDGPSLGIYLPMASRSILSGIKTSAVINVGTATLAALIGAGGLGEPILSGLNLNDHVTILEGAIPAA